MGMHPHAMIVAMVNPPRGVTAEQLEKTHFGDEDKHRTVEDFFVWCTSEEDNEFWITPDEGTLAVFIQVGAEEAMTWAAFRALVERFEAWLHAEFVGMTWTLKVGANYW